MCPNHEIDQKFRNLEVVADYACEVGENPLWHRLEKRLYWCDIPTGRIFRYDPATEAHEQCYQGRTVGGFTIQSDGSLLLFMDRGTIAIWREGDLTEIVPEIPIERASRFNDVIADPRGRVFCGTMSTEERRGSLYRLDCDGSLYLQLENIECSNGMAFTLDHKGFYYTDSLAHKIYFFDYDIENGTLSNQRIFVTCEKTDGLLDGATLDSDGNLWSALWDGSSIVRFLSDGKIGSRIALPTPKVASLTFGGEDFSDIYITTAGGNNKQENGELAGALFRLKAKTPGIPEFFSRISAKKTIRR
jgi:D-xylono/L-arabinono-1,4-lactonase